MEPCETQVIIAGGGLIGLTLAAILAQAHIRVAIIEARTPTPEQHNEPDPRVSAINLATERILQRLDIWSQLDMQSYSPVRRLRVWDHLGGGGITFDATDGGIAQCGYIIENRVLIQTLWRHVINHPHISVHHPARPAELWCSKDKVQLKLDNGAILYAPLLVGADGGRSWVRDQMAITVSQHDYLQQALLCVVNSQYPHQDTAWQNFLTTGPIALLPLADKHRGAIVWSTSQIDAQRLLALDSKSVGFELTNALERCLGDLVVISEKTAVPLVMRRVSDYVTERLALVGDAAHTIHPLAGQGVNLGFLDALCLAKVIIEAQQKQQDFGSLPILRRYQRWRKADNLAMQIVMTGFNQLFSNSLPWLVPLRSQGLTWANRAGFFKNWVMRYAAGVDALAKYDWP